jgi:hypothetical protein
MTRYSLTVAAAALAFYLTRGDAYATSMLYQDIASLTQSSDAVVHGTVKKTESHWTADHKRIVTDVTVEVAEFIKGTGARTVVVQQPGGEVDGIGQKVSGLAAFSQGEEVVLFLQHQGAAKYRLSGMAQGKYRVERSSDKTAAFVVPESTGDAMVIDPQTGAAAQADSKAIELASLRAKVRAAAKARPNEQPKRGKAP